MTEFKTPLVQGDYTFYLNEYDRAIVPDAKEYFEEFVDALFSFLTEPTDEQKKNYDLIKEYPFLLPKNRFDRGISIKGDHGFDFSWTELDALPKGWRIAFGESIIKELKDAILAYDEAFLYEYMITQIKEKYGGLRWYDNGATEKMYRTINKYEEMSKNLCIVCGKEVDAEELDMFEPLCLEHKN